MAGIMYHSRIIGSTPSSPIYRAFRVKTVSTSSGNHNYFGCMHLGNDYLFPSMEDSRDICAYVMGPEISDDASSPKFSFEANGRPHADSNIACLYATTTTVNDFPTTTGYWIASTKRYTTKFKASDYSSYDSALHRNAGVVGIVSESDIVNQYYNDLPHGSVFTFDTANNNPPCFAMLIATRNITVHDICFRRSSYSYSTSLQWGSGDFRAHQQASTTGYSFYCKSASYTTQHLPVLKNIYTIPQKVIVIDGNQYNLVLAYLDVAYTSTNNNWYRTFESPYIRVSRPDETALGRCYILDEAVTIHKPGVT